MHGEPSSPSPGVILDSRDPHGFTLLAILFELIGCVPLAWLLESVWAGPEPARPRLEPEAWLEGLLWTLPLAGFVALITWTPLRRLPFLERIRSRIREVFGRTIARLALWQIVVISIAAGVGEEVLFRGVLQPRLGLVVSSLLFGLLHPLTPSYALITAGLSLYLGWLFERADNLFVPIIVHGLYDLLAFVIFRHELRKEGLAEDEEDEPEEETDEGS
jgi:hypothetical protein